MLVFDMFVNLNEAGLLFGEGVGVGPVLHRAALLGIGEAMVGDVGVAGQPAHGQRAKPQGEFRERAFGQGFDVMQLDQEWGRGETPQGQRIVMKFNNRRK
jgi:hypothetical protein